jgi:hypothetical protein
MLTRIKRILKGVLPLSLIRRYNQYILKNQTKDFIHQPIEQVFKNIYKENYWQGNQSVSGRGSDLSQVREVQAQLPLLLRKYDIKTMLDIPCGDFLWMKEIDLSGVQYIGADIVEELVESNITKYGDKETTFRVLDLTKDVLPEVDLIFCRDCLVHLSFDHINAAIKNIKSSKSKYLLTTSFVAHKENFDIPTGNWRPLNLLRSPYNFAKPLEVINEKCTEDNGEWADKSLLLWELA